MGLSDDDTITALDDQKREYKVRLAGIDAPEMAQPFVMRSKQSLKDLVYDKTVELVTQKRDRSGRLAGKVARHGKDVNLEHVSRGMAWHYRAYADEQATQDRER